MSSAILPEISDVTNPTALLGLGEKVRGEKDKWKENRIKERESKVIWFFGCLVGEKDKKKSQNFFFSCLIDKKVRGKKNVCKWQK